MSRTHALTVRQEAPASELALSHQVFAKLTEEEKKDALTTFFKKSPSGNPLQD